MTIDKTRPITKVINYNEKFNNDGWQDSQSQVINLKEALNNNGWQPINHKGH